MFNWFKKKIQMEELTGQCIVCEKINKWIIKKGDWYGYCVCNETKKCGRKSPSMIFIGLKDV